jgi:hypothetical protein
LPKAKYYKETYGVDIEEYKTIKPDALTREQIQKLVPVLKDFMRSQSSGTWEIIPIPLPHFPNGKPFQPGHSWPFQAPHNPLEIPGLKQFKAP